MGTTFSKLYKNLLAWTGDVVPPSFAKLLTGEAIRSIYDEHDWGFLLENSYLRLPALIQTGTVSVTQFSNQVLLSATTKVLVDAITVDNVPLVERQFRTIQQQQTGKALNYNIADYDSGTGIITLANEYQDITNANSKFQILKMYYAPPFYIPQGGDPVIDFKGWEFVINPLWQRRIYLDTTQEELNRVDPIRTWQDEPRHIVPYSMTVDTEGNDIPLFEIYPAPRIERVLKVQYKRRGLIPTRDTEIVPFFDSELIVKKARIRAYEWILANTDKPAGKFLNMIGLLSNRNDPTSYPSMLQVHKDRDVELVNRTFMYDSLAYCDYGLGLSQPESTLVLSF